MNDPLAVLAKIREEADEIEREPPRPIARPPRRGRRPPVRGGHLARHLDADPEAVLRATNGKFERRFAAIERALADRGKTPQTATLEEMDDLWNQAKAAEQAEGSAASR